MGKSLGWVLALGLLLIGFLAGRASGRVDNQKLRDSVAVWKDNRKQDKAANEQLQRDLAVEHGLRAQSESATLRLTESAARLVAGAARTMVTANETRARADAILASLRNARTPAESIAVLTMACSERGNECTLVRKANDSLFRATDSLTIAGDSAKKTIASFRRDSVKLVDRIRQDSTRLKEADGLITMFERNARGCRIPLIDFPCPVPVAGYNVTASRFEAGAGVPLKIGPFRIVAALTWSP